MTNLALDIIEPEKCLSGIQESCVILNSRQGKTPCGSDPWVKSTIDAVKYAIRKDYRIITSIGMNTWELVLWCIREFGGKSIVLLPYHEYANNVDKLEYFIKDFGLNLHNLQFCFVKSPSKGRGKKTWWEERDKTAFDLAYEIIPVSVRQGGNWSKKLTKTSIDERPVNQDFKVCNETISKKDKSMSIEIPEVDISYTWHRLTHWTRRFYGPWPDESSKDYYAKVVHSNDVYSHRAKDSLANIIMRKTLYGSSSWMKDNKPSVSFTEHHPSEAVNLMKWRSRHVRYTFEPFGIAIDRQAAVHLGIKPVKYLKRDQEPGKKESIDYHTQSYDKGNWPQEKEWRFIGNLNLESFRKDDIKILVPTKDLITEFQNISPWEVIPLQSEEKS